MLGWFLVLSSQHPGCQVPAPVPHSSSSCSSCDPAQGLDGQRDALAGHCLLLIAALRFASLQGPTMASASTISHPVRQRPRATPREATTPVHVTIPVNNKSVGLSSWNGCTWTQGPPSLGVAVSLAASGGVWHSMARPQHITHAHAPPHSLLRVGLNDAIFPWERPPSRLRFFSSGADWGREGFEKGLESRMEGSGERTRLAGWMDGCCCLCFCYCYCCCCPAQCHDTCIKSH
ncbi:hypothetical protein EDB81DRAFT_399973 [Dactylonectria macrodidyma]|uniref:Uncharacterized protein n=1 Tax=Dactylonectria macrodidyma TaxID=307937 RepID=A0A9P9FB68_9HYPO|nr:hypothetical protein EDB81DRAFT_399973 [Dactylonectria macrodidyma]